MKRRRVDLEYDQNLKKTFQELGIPDSKIHYLKQHTVQDRVAEIISIISKTPLQNT